jgi:predicted Ser/Thr protein kinase
VHLVDGVRFGRYVLLEELGSGGMGVVYAALDPDLSRKVALKLLRRDRGGEQLDTDARRLLREAKAMARLHHPNVVTVHDVGSIDGRIFVAMEHVDGPTLGRWLAQGPHPWPEVLRVLVKAGRGLAAAHAAGFVHRDFKPENVLMGSRGAVKVVDFGLARRPDDDEARAPDGAPRPFLTRPGVVIGTPLYMAPEQHRGRSIDARADQFSFCAVLYEGLFGQRPFSGRNRHTLAVQACNGRVEPIPAESTVPAHIRDATLRGLTPDPADRFPSMGELLAALLADPARRRRRIGGAAVVSALAVIALAGLWWREPADPCPPPVAARPDDPWTERWSAAHVDACRAANVRLEQSQAAWTSRRRCLERLHDVVTAARESGTDDLELPAPERCLEADAEALARRLPEDPELAAAWRGALELQVRAAGLETAGVLEDAARLLAIARTGGDAALELELELLRGGTSMRADDPGRARAAFERASGIALELGDLGAAGLAFVGLADAALARDEIGPAREWLAYADAALARVRGSSSGASVEPLAAEVQRCTDALARAAPVSAAGGAGG